MLLCEAHLHPLCYADSPLHQLTVFNTCILCCNISLAEEGKHAAIASWKIFQVLMFLWLERIIMSMGLWLNCVLSCSENVRTNAVKPHQFICKT
ncbi:hypothetical protein GDO86_010928 [Hymenochirus boettgeri]|uniref:Uncharacterized protein n=1 Tax=Hymenochirus boettgeri TaxID=247094 RepID=A0A8T2JH59_9PIPI|nr:hypothetical protein GDO86_010928 [Hymenochirus boettgeri]